MNNSLVRPVGRRNFLSRTLAGGAYLLWSGSLPATPECRETEDNDEGPFYKKGAPDRETLLEGSIAGTRLSLKGRVMTTACAPLAGAVLDVWQADDNGKYDNSGFTLRGRFHADKSDNCSEALQDRRRTHVPPGAYPPEDKRVGLPDADNTALFPGGPVQQSRFSVQAFSRAIAQGSRFSKEGRRVRFHPEAGLVPSRISASQRPGGERCESECICSFQ